VAQRAVGEHVLGLGANPGLTLAYKVDQVVYGIHILVVASQAYVNTYSTRRVGCLIGLVPPEPVRVAAAHRTVGEHVLGLANRMLAVLAWCATLWAPTTRHACPQTAKGSQRYVIIYR